MFVSPVSRVEKIELSCFGTNYVMLTINISIALIFSFWLGFSSLERDFVRTATEPNAPLVNKVTEDDIWHLSSSRRL